MLELCCVSNCITMCAACGVCRQGITDSNCQWPPAGVMQRAKQQDGLTLVLPVSCMCHTPHSRKLLTAGMAGSTCLTALQNLGSLGKQGKNAGDGRLGRGRLPSLHQSRLRVAQAFHYLGRQLAPGHCMRCCQPQGCHTARAGGQDGVQKGGRSICSIMWQLRAPGCVHEDCMPLSCRAGRTARCKDEA